ncbi:hypothetical protein FRC06_004046 [Ceratobasidium sp. 370]|nr:hypothetical protein FRC06_004046 [Ceratobasidium sp. 370]
MPPPTHSRLSSRHTNPIEPPIGYDPQEEARIRLEQEIGGISLDLSRTGSSSLSLEYGRHGARSPRFEGVPTFARYDSDLDRSREVSTRRSTRQNQSLRTFDDSFDGGHTQSTTAHHASALTVGAGLGYGGAPRSFSRAGSGVEYDPDRELSEMLKRRGRISVLDDTNATRDRTRSAPNKKHSQHLTSDPLIVDDTVELDRLLETGHLSEHALQANPRIPRAHPREHDSPRADLESQSSFHRSEADDSTTGRRKPRLTDALGGAFSPKRPRTMTSTLSPTSTAPKPLPAITSMSETSVRPSTSLLASRPSNFPSAPLRTESSLTSSNGTQKARLEANTAANARRALDKPGPAHMRNTSTAAPRQEPAVDRQREVTAGARASAFTFPREPMSEARNRTIGMSIHLPDVTGLTAAVESPSKANVRYRDAQVGMPANGLDADRTMTNAQLEQLSERLRELERENGTARRRVRELEMELEYCKAEVEREKTRANMQEAERTRAKEMQAANEREEQVRRLRQAEAATTEWETRYREVVEEKKALEALVTTLQSHLARMTSEVEEHQRTIEDLRSMHERDAAELEVKTAEPQTEGRQSPPPERRTPPPQEAPVPQQPVSPSPQRRQPSLLAPQSPPFPRIRGAKLEQLFFSVPEHNERTCTACCGRRRVRIMRDDRHEPERVREREKANWRLGGDAGAPRRADDDEGYVEGDEEVEVDMRRPPPQTVLVKVVRELEDDFAHYKAIYIELADQYRIIGPASNVAKRNVLAEHLKEVIDTLEKKGDQIASLYDLLQFNDKPAPGPSSKQRS